MADRTIEHDPETGCSWCPFYSDEMGQACGAVPLHRDGLIGYGGTPLGTEYDVPAPSWCPLRSGAVVVRAKGAT